MFTALFLLLLPFGVASMAYLLLLAVRQMAENDFVFTLVPERAAKAVVSGQGGGLTRMLIQFKGHHLRADNLIVNHEDPRHPDYVEDPDYVPHSDLDRWMGYLGLTGVKFLGIPGMHEVYSYPFQQAQLVTSGGSKPRTSIRVESLTLDYISLREGAFYVPVPSAETAEKLPLDVGLVVTLVPCNPEKALFAIDKWLAALSNQLMSSFRRLVGVLDWDSIQKAVEFEFLGTDLDAEELTDRLTLLTDDRDARTRRTEIFGSVTELLDLRENMRDAYGIRIKKLQVGQASLAGPRAAELAAAGTKEYEADREARRIDTVYGAIAAKGEVGLLVQFTDALRDISRNPGSTIIPFPAEISRLLEGMPKTRSDS